MALTQISTAGVKDDAVTAGKIPANAVGSSELADNAVTSAKIASGGVQASNINSNAVSTDALQSNAVNTNKIADGAVTAAKLASGVQTTINNNADNRVITGSGTANTLNGEANFTFNSKVILSHAATTTISDRGFQANASSDLTDGQYLPALGLNPNAGNTDRTRAGIAGVSHNGTAGMHLVFLTRHAADGTQLNSSDEKMRLDTSGRLGIGTTSPNSELVVQGTAHSNLQVWSGSASTKAFIQTVQDSDVRIGTSTNHPVSFYTNGAERMRLLSGGGLTFNGDTAAANALDDYEEGTFTPEFNSGSAASACYAGGVSYSSQVGVYRKVGHVVHFILRIVVSSGTLKNGVLQINNLPFTSGNFSSFALTGGAFMSYTTGFFSDTAHIPRIFQVCGGTQLQFYNTAGNNFAGSHLAQAAGRMDVHGHYFTSD